MGAEEAGEQGSRGAGGNEELEKYLEREYVVQRLIA
jgi:hypothetical protein